MLLFAGHGRDTGGTRAGHGRDTGGTQALQTMNIIIIVITRSHCSPLHFSSPAMSDQESGALASPTGRALQGRALLSMLQDGDPPQRASASEPQPLSRDEFLLWSLQAREDAEIGADALNAETFGADAGQGWSFEENLAANWGLLPPGRWADVQGAEQSPAGPGREVQASLQAAGQQSGELRRRVDELEAMDKSQDTAKRALEALAEVLAWWLAQAVQQSGELRRRVDELERENKWLLNLVDTADDAARSACEALEEVRASEADLRQRLAQMEADAALGAEPGGREEHVVP